MLLVVPFFGRGFLRGSRPWCMRENMTTFAALETPTGPQGSQYSSSNTIFIMKLLLKRYFLGPHYTCGHLFIQTLVPVPEGEQDVHHPGCPEGFCHEWALLCDTLEPPVQQRWRDRSTTCAIPAGDYPLVVSFSPKFQTMLPLLLNVPGRSGIRIHAGNRAHLDPAQSDTTGCILVGSATQRGTLTDSRRALALLKQRLRRRPEGEAVRVKVES